MNARELALTMLLQITEEKKLCHTVLARELGKYPGLDKRERAFAARLCEGVVERMLTLDYLISRCSSVKPEKQKPVVRNILRMGFYQLNYMEVPPSAVCNEAVKLAKKRGFAGLSGFVNGVLRAAARETDGLSAAVAGLEREERLSVLYSVPAWLVGRFLDWYGEESTERMFRAFLEEPALTARVNLSKCSADQCRQRLESEGLEVCGGVFVPEALRLSGIDSPGRIGALRDGFLQIQDESSMLPVLCAGIKPGDYVIDCCAAPGGKALQAADLLLRAGRNARAQGSQAEPPGADRPPLCAGQSAAAQESGVPLRGLVSARDISEYKLSKIRENISRCGFPNVEVLLWDACRLRQEDAGKADVVLADLPCSGLGIIARKPDIKYNASPEGLSELVRLQRRMLETAAKYVKPGGVLIYSTCTVNPEENRENAEWIERELGLEAQSLLPYLPEKMRAEEALLPEAERGRLQLLPEPGRTDGFFVSRFVRPAEEQKISGGCEWR
ncbi:MAG: 16S rRNA (cytosine(967)-C(5))-methyltransferase [Lachnospiraceae bacterium]|nr:16S rRNA (cytosine(967)-C(5))-methyltransferase [Lachnospiraceae bacterium]